jgi:hypothetical protein
MIDLYVCPKCGNDDPEAFDFGMHGLPGERDSYGTIDCLECNDRRRMTKEMWALAIAHEKGEQYE